MMRLLCVVLWSGISLAAAIGCIEQGEWHNEPPALWEKTEVTLGMRANRVEALRPTAEWDDSANGYTESLPGSEFPMRALYVMSWDQVEEIVFYLESTPENGERLLRQAQSVLDLADAKWGRPERKGTILHGEIAFEAFQWEIGRAICTLSFPSRGAVERSIRGSEYVHLRLMLTISKPSAEQRRRRSSPIR